MPKRTTSLQFYITGLLFALPCSLALWVGGDDATGAVQSLEKVNEREKVRKDNVFHATKDGVIFTGCGYGGAEEFTVESADIHSAWSGGAT